MTTPMEHLIAIGVPRETIEWVNKAVNRLEVYARAEGWIIDQQCDNPKAHERHFAWLGDDHYYVAKCIGRPFTEGHIFLPDGKELRPSRQPQRTGVFLPDGNVAPDWYPNEDGFAAEVIDATPIFVSTFLDLACCPFGQCDWTAWDGTPHIDPPEYGYHSTGCREGPYHCGPCDTSEAIAELHREMAQIRQWERDDDVSFRDPLFEPDESLPF